VTTLSLAPALVLVEELLDAGAQVVIVDPVGVCWGLRGAAPRGAAFGPAPVSVLDILTESVTSRARSPRRQPDCVKSSSPSPTGV